MAQQCFLICFVNDWLLLRDLHFSADIVFLFHGWVQQHHNHAALKNKWGIVMSRAEKLRTKLEMLLSQMSLMHTLWIMNWLKNARVQDNIAL